MKLIPIVVKKKRTDKGATLNFHTHKAFGMLLNPDACHGKGYVVRRVIGQQVSVVLGTLREIAKEL